MGFPYLVVTEAVLAPAPAEGLFPISAMPESSARGSLQSKQAHNFTYAEIDQTDVCLCVTWQD